MLSPGFTATLGSVAASSPIPPKLNGSLKTGVQVSDPQASTHLNKNSERCCLRDRSEHHKLDRGLSKCEFLRSICSKTSICFLVQRRYASLSPRTTPRRAPESQLALAAGVLAPLPKGEQAWRQLLVLPPPAQRSSRCRTPLQVTSFTPCQRLSPGVSCSFLKLTLSKDTRTLEKIS